MGGRAFGPPLCRGCAPATPPSKTIAHRRYASVPAALLCQRDACQPKTISASLHGGKHKRLVKTALVRGLEWVVETSFQSTPWGHPLCVPSPRRLDYVDETSTLLLWRSRGKNVSLQICEKFLPLIVANPLANQPAIVATLPVGNNRLSALVTRPQDSGGAPSELKPERLSGFRLKPASFPARVHAPVLACNQAKPAAQLFQSTCSYSDRSDSYSAGTSMSLRTQSLSTST